MSAAVGAALKKVLVAILTEPKVLKNILFAILVVVVAMILPTVFVVSIFSGDFEVDTASLKQYVEENLSAADIVLLTNVENTMEAIEEAMIEAELGSEARTAQVLYVLALSDYASQPGFVSRLVSCFRPEQTDSQLVNAELSETAMQHKLIDHVIDWNLDMGIVSYMNTQTGFQSFYLESDVLKAEMATKASACESFEQITEQFHQKLVGKECDVYGTYLPQTKADQVIVAFVGNRGIYGLS